MKRNLLFLGLLVIGQAASAAQVLINSPASYLRAVGESPFNPNFIDLNAVGFFAGQSVFVSRLGSWNHLGGATPTDFGLSAVFSSSTAVLPPTALNRIPGAIAAGTPWVSPNTQIGNVPTDITEDFLVDNMAGTANGVFLTIPAGALYLFGGATDNFYQDNNNTPEFYLRIQHVPEPSPIIAVALAGGLAQTMIRRRRTRK